MAERRSEQIAVLHIPSRNLYLHKGEVHASLVPQDRKRPLFPIPSQEVDNERMFEADVKAWRDPVRSILEPVYVDRVIDPSSGETIHELTTKMLNGAGVRFASSALRHRFIDITMDHLIYLFGPDGEELNEDDIELLLSHPVSPSADPRAAATIAITRSLPEIRDYLNRVGVTHLVPEEFFFLDHEDVFFYLTRFYGPPVYEALEIGVAIREMFRRANNRETRGMVRMIRKRYADYLRNKELFDVYFEAMKDEANHAAVLESVGTSELLRFLNSPLDYIMLIGRSRNLPPLTLVLIREMGITTEASTVDLLNNYTDDEIESLVGKIDEDSRERFIEEAAVRLLERGFVLLTAEEAKLCSSPESVTSLEEFSEIEEVYFGYGSVATGFDCFTFNDLLLSWRANTDEDGVTHYRSPVNANQVWTSAELEQLKLTLQRGRESLFTAPDFIIDEVSEAVEKAKSQEDGTAAALRLLSAWANRDEANRALLRSVWTTMFELGMYMRQWRGPGTPYPIRAETTGREFAPGTDQELSLATNVTDAKTIYDKLISRLPEEIRTTIESLLVMRLYGDAVERRAVSIKTLYDLTLIEGRECIRMASGLFSFTAAYYLKQTLDDEIPGYDLSHRIEYIQ